MNRKKSIPSLEPKLTTQLSSRSFTKPTETQAGKIKNTITGGLGKENLTRGQLNKKKLAEDTGKSLGLKKIKDKIQRERVDSTKSSARNTPLSKIANQQNNPSSGNLSNKKLDRHTLNGPTSSGKSSQKNLLKSLKLQSDQTANSGISNTTLYHIQPTEQETKPITHQNPQQRTVMISMFKILDKLNQSALSTSFKVFHIQSGLLFCLKVFSKEKVHRQGMQEQMFEEIKFRMQRSHANMQKLFSVFDDEMNIYYLEEYIPGFGEIQNELRRHRRLCEKECGFIARGAIDLIQFMHSEGYIHRDLKVQNLAVAFGIVKATDFSWVTTLRNKKHRDTFCGSYNQAPPELLEGFSYDESIDLWCLGTLIYELSTGVIPFENGSQIRSHDCLTFPISMSNELVDLLGKLLSNKDDRMGLQEVTENEWIKKVETDGFVCRQIWSFWANKV